MKRLVPLFLFLLLASQSLFGWTQATDERIAARAAQLAPPDMKLVLDKFEQEYRTGIARASADEARGGHDYFVASKKGLLRDRIVRETTNIVAQLRKRDAMSRVAERLGILAHIVADANDPFHVSEDDPRLAGVRADYYGFMQRNQPRFVTVFYGLDPDFRLQPYIDRAFSRTAKLAPLLSTEYFHDGQRHTSAEFDDRSTGFGVAAVSHSHAVTDLVNLYYYIWKEAGGDVRTARAMRRGRILNP